MKKVGNSTLLLAAAAALMVVGVWVAHADATKDRQTLAKDSANRQLCSDLTAAYNEKDPTQRAADWEKVYGQDPSLRGNFTYSVTNTSATGGPGIADNPSLQFSIQIQGKDGPVNVWQSQPNQDANNVLQMLKVFKDQGKFNLTRPVSADELARDLANSSSASGLARVKKQASQSSTINTLFSQIRDNAWAAINDQIVAPRMKKCSADKAKAFDPAQADAVDRSALHDKDSDFQLQKCDWKSSEPPHALLASCGTFCSGSADCTYKRKDGSTSTVTRTIGCHVSSSGGTQVNCGDATACHKDPIRFPTATFNPPAPTGGTPVAAPNAEKGT